MPIFSAAVALFSAVSTFIGGLGAIGVAALQMAAGVGINLILAAVKGKPQQQKAGIQGKLSAGGDVSRSIMVGQYNTAGSLVYRNTYGQSGDTPNAFYVEVRALADLPVGGLIDVWVDGEKVGLVPEAYGLSSTKHIKYGTKWGDLHHLWFQFYDGTQTTADARLVSWFGASARPYGGDRVGHGVPYVIITALRDDLENDNPLFNGFPLCKFTLAGTRFYDPSRDSTVGGVGAQRWSDPSTWGGDGDNLPAVQIYNILRGIRQNGRWLYGLQGANPAILPPANWIAAINKCRTVVDGPDGPEPQYRSGAQIDVSIAPADLIETLLKTCSGRLTEVGGVYTIHVGEPEGPALSFTDADILSTEEQVYDPFRSLADSINGAVAKYPEPLEGWNVKTSPVSENPAQIVRDGNRELIADVDLAACSYHGQVQRLLKSAILEAARERRHTIVLPPWAQCLEPGDIVAWTSARNGYEGKLFRIDGMAYKANLDVMLQITEVDPSDYDWNQDVDYIPPSFSPMQILRPAPQPIVDWYAEGQIVYDAQGLPRRPQVYMSWDGSKSDIDGVSYEIAQSASEDDVIVRGRTDDAQRGSIVVSSQSFIPGSTVYARGRYIPSSPRAMDWSDWLPALLPNVNYGLVDFDAAVQKQVTEILDKRFEESDKKIALLGQLVSQAMSRTSLDKQIVKSDMNAVAGGAKASIEEVRTVAVDAQTAVADLSTAVAVEFDGLNASVIENSTAIATLDGYAAAKWSVAVDADGNAVGLVLFNDTDNVSFFTVTADTFQVAFPGHAGGSAVSVFTIANVGGVAKLALRGDMIVDGSIISQMISAGAVTAVKISANSIGTGQLAIGGVDILNIIDGAASALYPYTFAQQTPPNFAPFTFFSDNVNIQSGRAIALIQVYAVDPKDGTGSAVDMIINGTVVANQTITTAGGFFIAYAKGLPAGNVNFALRSSGHSGAIGGGVIIIFNNRR